MSQAAKKLAPVAALNTKKDTTASETAREAIKNIANAADMVPHMLTETTEICQGNAEVLNQCTDIALTHARTISDVAMESYHRSFAEGVEISKAIFSCRTLNDIIELQNRTLQYSLDHCFTGSGKLLNLSFECSTALLKPLQDQAEDISERLNNFLKA